MAKRLWLILLVVGILTLPSMATVPDNPFTKSFTCTGSAGPFSFNFPISDPTALTVTLNGTVVPSTSYTIVPVNNNYSNGGLVTLTSACTAGATLVLTRETDITQTLKFYDNMPIPMSTFERGLDKATEIMQEIWGNTVHTIQMQNDGVNFLDPAKGDVILNFTGNVSVTGTQNDYTIVGTGGSGGTGTPGGTLGQKQIFGTGQVFSGSVDTISTSAFTGADWCAKVAAARTAWSGIPVTFTVNQQGTDTTTCSVDIALDAGQSLQFTESGTYNLVAHVISPGGEGTRVLGSGWGTVLSYTGSSFAITINTQAETQLRDFQLDLGTASAGGIYIEHENLSDENPALNLVDNVKIHNAVHTLGQVGVELKTKTLNAANYLNNISVYTNNIDVGVRLTSAISTNSPNGEVINVHCTWHYICVDWQDGTDNLITGAVSSAFPPVFPTTTPTGGVAGVYSYTVSVVTASGERVSPAGATAAGPTTLDGTHYNTITSPAPLTTYPPCLSMNVYRNIGGAAQGKIASGLSCGAINLVDNGLTATGGTGPYHGIGVDACDNSALHGNSTSGIDNIIFEQGNYSVSVLQQAGGIFNTCGIGINLGTGIAWNDITAVIDNSTNMKYAGYVPFTFYKGFLSADTSAIVGAPQPLELFSNTTFGPQIVYGNQSNNQIWTAGISGSSGATQFIFNNQTITIPSNPGVSPLTVLSSTTPVIFNDGAPDSSLVVDSNGMVETKGLTVKSSYDLVLQGVTDGCLSSTSGVVSTIPCAGGGGITPPASSGIVTYDTGTSSSGTAGPADVITALAYTPAQIVPPSVNAAVVSDGSASNALTTPMTVDPVTGNTVTPGTVTVGSALTTDPHAFKFRAAGTDPSCGGSGLACFVYLLADPTHVNLEVDGLGATPLLTNPLQSTSTKAGYQDLGTATDPPLSGSTVGSLWWNSTNLMWTFTSGWQDTATPPNYLAAFMHSNQDDDSENLWNTQYFPLQLAKIEAGQSVYAPIVFSGDSDTSGFGVGQLSFVYPFVTMAESASKGWDTAGAGWASVYGTKNAMPTGVTSAATGSWTYCAWAAGTVSNGHSGACWGPDNVDATSSTSGDHIDWTFTGTDACIYYAKQTGGGTVHLYVDGSDNSNANSGSASSGVGSLCATSLTYGSHTIKFQLSTSTVTTALGALLLDKSHGHGVTVLKLAAASNTAANFATNPNYQNALTQLQTDLTSILGVGIVAYSEMTDANEWAQGITPAATVTSVNTLVTAAKAVAPLADIIIMSDPDDGGNYGGATSSWSYDYALQGYANKNRYPFISMLRSTYPEQTNSNANRGMYASDNIHLAPAGQQKQATIVLNRLAGARTNNTKNGAGYGWTTQQHNGGYTVLATDCTQAGSATPGNLLVQGSVGGGTYTLPASTVLPPVNSYCKFWNVNAGTLTIAAGAGTSLQAATTTFAIYEGGTVEWDGNFWRLVEFSKTNAACPTCAVGSGFPATELVIGGGGQAIQTDTHWTSTASTLAGDASATLDLSALPATTGLKLPTAAGAIPTVDGQDGFNSTTHAHVWGSNGTTIVGAAAATGTNASTTCSNQVVTEISAVAAPTCSTVVSTMTDNSIAHTGTDINTSNQVTQAQGGKVTFDANGKVTTLDNIATAGNGVPAIRYAACSDITSTAGTGVISSIALIASTPGAEHYIVTVDAEVKTQGTGGTCNAGNTGVFLGWTTKNGTTAGFSSGTTATIPFYWSNSSSASVILTENAALAAGNVGRGIPMQISTSASSAVTLYYTQAVGNNCSTPAVVTFCTTVQDLGAW